MRKNKLISILGLSLAVVGLASCGGDEDADPTLYHLTLSSNMSEKVAQEDLKATYGYGEPGLTVVEGTRDEDEIAELKKAGASDADIEKAGKRQDDGSYYFFNQDPVYLEAPEIKGYRLDGFYDKSTNKLEDKATIQGPADNRLRSRWNMNNRDTELEARYSEVKYTISFDNMETGDTNPNTGITDYQFLRDGDGKHLADATTIDPAKTFVCWEYQGEEFGSWIEIVDGVLPCDYDSEYMRIHAKFETAKYKIDFAFRKDGGGDLEWADVIDTMTLKNANLVTVDGVAKSGEDTALTNNSVIKIDGVSGYAAIFFTLKPEYELFYFEVNGTRNESINSAALGYIGISQTDRDLSADSTITFVVADAH